MDPKIAEFKSYVPFGEIDVEVTVEITQYAPGSPARLHGHPDTWHEHEPPEVEFRVRDHKGRRNAAIEHALDLDTRNLDRLEIEAINHMEAQA